MKTLAFLTIALLTFDATAHAQDRRPRPVIRIAVEVSGRDGLDSTIKSYLTREFRRIDDVLVTDGNPIYRIGCVAMKNHNKAGHFTGYTLSFVVTNTMPATLTMMTVEDKLPKEQVDFLRHWNTNRGSLVHHMVEVCAPQELQKVCAELVAQFDGSLIESARQFALRSFERSKPAP